jgi:hypothetical protein
MPWRRSTWTWLAGLLALCAALRLFLLLATDPILSPDSRSYMQLAQQIAAADLSADSGLRTPIYPLFLALLANDSALVRLVQMGLGLALTALMFWLGRRMTGSDVAAAAVGAGYGLSFSQIFFESNVLTETLTTFGVTLSVIALLLAFAWLDEERLPFTWVATLGIMSAVTALVRPTFVFLPVLLAGMLLLKLRMCRSSQRMCRSSTPAHRGAWLLVLALLPAIIVVGGWSAFNYTRFGYFGPSTITGFTLTDHSIGFIEYAPDRYAVIRDTYLDLRRQYGIQYVSVWLGVEPIKEKLGLTTSQLSRELTRMSLELFARQPLQYARSVWITWVQFWNAYGGYHGVVAWPGARSPALALLLGYLFRAMKYLYILFNALFLAWAGAAALVLVCLRACPERSEGRRPLPQRSSPTDGDLRRFGWVTVSLLVMTAVILITSLLSSAMQGGGLTAGGSNRYAMPVQPLLVCVVIAEGFHFVTWISSRSARTLSLLRPMK